MRRYGFLVKMLGTGLILLVMSSFINTWPSGKVLAQESGEQWETEKKMTGEGWGDGWVEEDSKSPKNHNIFFETDKLLVKIAWFLLLVVLSYIIFWLLFRTIIKNNKSPAKSFTWWFFSFMLSIYLAAFFCFSEYTLVQEYDPEIFYLSQLNWTWLSIILLVWSLVSIGLTYLLKGQS